MEKYVSLILPVILCALSLRAMLLPMKWGAKIAVHVLAGFFCLWMLNLISTFTGVHFPINPVTVAVAGVCGLPGIAVLALIQIFW